MKILTPLYGLTESKNSCLHKYTSYLKKTLRLRYITGDLSFSYQIIGNVLHELLEAYVEDTLAAGTQDFMKLTDKIPDRFELKTRESYPILSPKLTFT